MTIPNSKRDKVGLREIAQLAGVSLATVSRVLNGNMRVDESLQKMVLDAAAKLDIDVSSRNKTKALAFLLSNRAMVHAFHSRVLIGAEAHCTALGWDMVFLLRGIPNMVWWVYEGTWESSLIVVWVLKWFSFWYNRF